MDGFGPGKLTSLRWSFGGIQVKKPEALFLQLFRVCRHNRSFVFWVDPGMVLVLRIGVWRALRHGDMMKP